MKRRRGLHTLQHVFSFSCDMHMTRKKRLILASCLAGYGVVPTAHADIYKCVDDSGRVTYSNISNKGCTKLNLEPLSTIPSGAPRAQEKPGGSSSPQSFPKVDNDTQKKRDSDRRKILEQELAAEEKSLEQAQKELAEQEAVRYGDERNYQRVLERLQPYKDKAALHERNVEALKRELANLR